MISATINSLPVRLRVDPGAPTIPTLNPALIARLRVEAGLVPAVARVGPVRVPGKTAVVRFRLPGSEKEKKARVVWFASNAVEGADGIVHPLFLVQNRVRFDLGGQGGRMIVLPLVNLGGRGRGVLTPFSGEPIQLRFSLAAPYSSATADAGRLLAQQHDGRLASEGGAMLIAFGVTRPWRELKLSSAAGVGPFSLTSIRVRVPDSGSTGIAEEDADPDEIVVTGRSKLRPSRVIGIGRDRLSRCAWMETDRAAGTIRFNCPPP